jgi:MFS family permease
MVYAALILFLLGTLIGATAKNFTFLLVGRTVQGIGGGGIVSLTDIIVTDIVPLRLRGNYVGIISSQWAISSVAGPVIGKTPIPPQS